MWKTLAITALVLIVPGCTSYSEMIPGHVSGEYFVVTSRSYLLFSRHRIDKYVQVADGPYAGRWAKVAPVVPTPLLVKDGCILDVE